MERKVKLIIKRRGMFNGRIKTDTNQWYRVRFVNITQVINFCGLYGSIVKYERF